MIYLAKIQGKHSKQNVVQDIDDTVLISGLNDANALDILGRYLDKGITNISRFEMIGESEANGDIISIYNLPTT